MSRAAARPRRRQAGRSSAAAACALLALAGCRSVPEPEAADWSTAVDAGTVAAAPASRGAIYQRTYYAPLFENPTARRVGDLVTVRLEERTTAAKSATTSTSKSTSTQIPGPTIGGRPVTVNGVPILETDLGSEHEFDGQGDSQQSNRLDGTNITPVIDAASNFQSHATSNVANVSQRAALAAVSGDLSAVHMMRSHFERRGRIMAEMLDALPGITCLQPEGAFYCFPSFEGVLGREVGGATPASTLELADVILSEAKVALVPGEAFGAPGYMRLSFALGDDDLVEGITRIGKLLA